MKLMQLSSTPTEKIDTVRWGVYYMQRLIQYTEGYIKWKSKTKTDVCKTDYKLAIFFCGNFSRNIHLKYCPVPFSVLYFSI